MFISTLNFEELLIHDPLQLVNFSNSQLDVALTQEQYIKFFSNTETYNGLYYDENMDFCVFFYADPLQSSKTGEHYAQGQIDVSMKIYRMKILCNVRTEQKGTWNVTNTGILVKEQQQMYNMVISGALSNLTKAQDMTGYKNLPDSGYKAHRPTLKLDYSGSDFVIEGVGIRGLRNG